MNDSTDTNTTVTYLIVLYPSTCSVVTIDHHTPIYNLTHPDFTSLLKLNRQPFCFAVNVKVKEHDYQLGLFDTAGQEEYQGLRLLSYPGTHVFLMCFSIVMPESMKNLELKWIPEVRHQMPNAAYILVGTQVDLRDDEKIGQKLQKRRQKPVTAEEGQKLAKRLNCECYVECSALTRQGLKDVFDEALIAVLDPKVKKKTATGGRFKCAIL